MEVDIAVTITEQLLYLQSVYVPFTDKPLALPLPLTSILVNGIVLPSIVNDTRSKARFPAPASDRGFPHPNRARRPRPPRLLHHAGCRRQDRRQGAVERWDALQLHPPHAGARTD